MAVCFSSAEGQAQGSSLCPSMADRAIKQNVQLQCPACSRKFSQQASDVEAATEDLRTRVWQHCSQKHQDLTWKAMEDLQVTCYSLDWAQQLPCPKSPAASQAASQNAPQGAPHNKSPSRSPARSPSGSSPRRLSPRSSRRHSQPRSPPLRSPPPEPRRSPLPAPRPRSRSRRRSAGQAQLYDRVGRICAAVILVKHRLEAIETDIASLLRDAGRHRGGSPRRG